MADDIQNQLAALLAQAQQNQPQAQPSAWSKPQPQTAIAGVSVPISIETPKGKIRCYLSLPPECGSNPDALLAALAELDAAGYPLDIWQRDQSSGGGGWNRGGGGYNGGGWGGNRGGWRR